MKNQLSKEDLEKLETINLLNKKELNEDDAIVLTLNIELSPVAYNRLKKNLECAFNHKNIILLEHMKIEIIQKAKK